MHRELTIPDALLDDDSDEEAGLLSQFRSWETCATDWEGAVQAACWSKGRGTGK